MSWLNIEKNDAKAKWLIYGFSAVIFVAITFLGRVKLDVSLPFDEHLFASANALINSIVSLLLLAGLYTARTRRLGIHRKIMLAAMGLSVLFLVSYVCHHLFTGESLFGDVDKDGVLSAAERQAIGSLRTIYLVILLTHIVLAAVVLPFILFTAYRALIGEHDRHRRLAKITWPIWFYVAVTGPVIYLMISKYY